MVAISLYRGNLHRVPDVPRRWLMPTPKISLKDFKSLLSRRSKALSRHRSAAATSSNANPSFDPDQPSEAAKVAALNQEPKVKFEAPPEKVVADCEAGPSGEVKDKRQPEGGDVPAKEADLTLALRADLAEKGWEDPVVVKVEKVNQLENPNSEIKEVVLDEKQKRKREVEEKLQVLNQKKHNLVQVLKQILNAEEELKRRSSAQGIVVRPTVSLQVDVTNDSGSMNRQVTPRFHIPPGQVWGQLVLVLHALLPQGTKGLLLICQQYLHQEQTSLHPLRPLQHPEELLLSETHGCQVHGTRYLASVMHFLCLP